MSTTPPKPLWPREDAAVIGQQVIERLKPHCCMIEIAGSFRRGRAAVRDLEIVFVPRFATRARDLLETEQYDLAAHEIEAMLADGTITKRQSRLGRPAGWGPLNKLALHREGLALDFFTTNVESWHNYMVCRTGPAELNTTIAQRALKKGWRWNPYGVGFSRTSDPTETIRMTTEEAVFEFVGLQYQPPTERD